jgi:predicted TIM-barrel fold metal-dependent hydrolase
MPSSGWLDVHGHFFPPSDPSQLEALFNKSRTEDAFLIPEGYTWSIEDTLAYLDTAGVQMQILSYLPQNLAALREANDYAASTVKKWPSRFGYFAALPTEDATASLQEIDRVLKSEQPPDGFAVTACRKGVYFSDPSLLPVWKRLDELHAVVHMHPMAYGPPKDGRPVPLIEVAFETARVATDMIYRRLLQKFPNIEIILAHSGGVLPALSGRLALLGTEPWVPNPNSVSKEDIKEQLGRFWVDTAATAETGLGPAVKMVGRNRVLYGADCGVPCSTCGTMDENKASIHEVASEMGFEGDEVGRNAWALFPDAIKRVDNVNEKEMNGKIHD